MPYKDPVAQEAYFKEYRETHKAQKQAYRERNKDKIREYKRLFRAQNADRLRVEKHDYYHSHREERLQYTKKYYAENVRPYWHRKYQRGIDKALRKGGEIIDRESIRSFYKQVYTQTAAVCEYCRGIFPAREIVVEHKQPYVLGGFHGVTNFAISCNPCNLRKGKTPYDKWIAFAEKGTV